MAGHQSTRCNDDGPTANADNVQSRSKLFMRFKARRIVGFSSDGAGRAVLSSYAVPIKLKDECLPFPAFRKDPPPGIPLPEQRYMMPCVILKLN
jgi:hypothetical protein